MNIVNTYYVGVATHDLKGYHRYYKDNKVFIHGWDNDDIEKVKERMYVTVNIGSYRNHDKIVLRKLHIHRIIKVTESGDKIINEETIKSIEE